MGAKGAITLHRGGILFSNHSPIKCLSLNICIIAHLLPTPTASYSPGMGCGDGGTRSQAGGGGAPAL